ncbi:ATP-binding cassette domain-containing protein [Brevibacillus sp. SKDU10]|uniref:ATP-binding cassette domain-containing protein n=1 Tax=Brevibacillus sp. SKDU10 TaxID=1247872 RepID=UPI000A628BC2|nr:ATP-binding cassette domain-containing protein [Brevibacillus sp. SKDU10]
MEQVLEIVGLKTDKVDRGNDKVKTYSLGMKQRLGIAQSLLNNPRIVILDESANGLDPMGMRELRELIVRLKESFGITFFISSHLLDELQKICNRFVIIKEGRMKWYGDDKALLEQMEEGMTLKVLGKEDKCSLFYRCSFYCLACMHVFAGNECKSQADRCGF